MSPSAKYDATTPQEPWIHFNPREMNAQMYGPLVLDIGKKLVEQLHPQVFLYAYEDKFAVLDLDRQTVWYVMTFKKTNILSESCISEIFVWRNMGENRTDVLAKRIFFKSLLPMGSYAVTQQQPTGYNKAFWELRIAQAFGQGLPVSLWSLSEGTKNPIATYDDFLDLGDIWCGTNTHQNVQIIAISSINSG